VAESAHLLQGTLDLLILKSLSLGQLHGLAIAQRIEQLTRGALRVKPGSLFPALYRMAEKGWLESDWGESIRNRRVRYYRLTRAGRNQLRVETEAWERSSRATALVLRAT
jgi:transcriptional regulator